MRRMVKIVGAAAALAAAGWLSAAQANFYGLPRALVAHLSHMSFDAPSLAPMAYTRFCLQYPGDCEVRGMMASRRGLALTEARWADLAAVNRAVNRAIEPQANEGGLFAEAWLLSPKAGDCNDYAVTKRHQLLARGWPSRALILTEVVVPSGKGHLVLVVRTREGDFVLDNLNANVRTVSQTRYRWVRAQLPKNPNFWASVSVPPPVRTVMLEQ